MGKLVILNQGMTGRTYDLKVGRNTIGREKDNAVEIPDASVSGHHCEVHWRGTDTKEILFRDLNSTNGSFLNGEKTSETLITHGQSLRLGQVELKFDDGSGISLPAAPAAPTPPPSSAPAPAPKKTSEGTVVASRGVSLTDLEQSGARTAGFDTNASFSKKSNKTNRYFIIGGIVVGVIIVGILIYALMQAGGGSTR